MDLDLHLNTNHQPDAQSSANDPLEPPFRHDPNSGIDIGTNAEPQLELSNQVTADHNANTEGSPGESSDESKEGNSAQVNGQTEEERDAEQKATREAEAIVDLADIQSRMEECAVCYEDKPLSEVLQMACGNHWLCRGHCIEIFQRATESQANYPPQCCELVGRIELNVVDHWLPDQLITEYTRKLDEYHTDVRLRCYCGDEQCRTFLPPDSYQDFAADTFADCSKCCKSTCVTCKELVVKEQPHRCESVVINETNAAYSADMRFKACPYCGRFGQLENACNHVTCLASSCNGEWCFICLQPWEQGSGHDSCQQYNDPEYNALGYDQNGFHRDTGLDAQGFSRGGYNIQGRNRAGERMTNFAKRVAPSGFHGARPPPGFANIGDEEDIRMALFMELIGLQERGELAADANLEDILNDRLATMGIGRQRHGHDRHQAPQDAGLLDEEEGSEEEGDSEDEDAEDVDDPNPNNLDNDGDDQVQDDGENIEQVAEVPARAVELFDAEAPAGGGWVGEQEDDTANNDAAHPALHDEQQDEQEEPTAEHIGPPFQQRNCAHNFEQQPGGIFCSICSERTDEHGVESYLYCQQCQAITCIACGVAYTDMIKIYWPEVDEEGDEEVDNAHDFEIGMEEPASNLVGADDDNMIDFETEAGATEHAQEELDVIVEGAANYLADSGNDGEGGSIANTKTSTETDNDGDIAMTDGW
jgi:hypothetical protein